MQRVQKSGWGHAVNAYQGRALPPLDDRGRDQPRRHVLERAARRQNLPHDDAERVDVDALVIVRADECLGRHPVRRAAVLGQVRLALDDLGRQLARLAQVGQLDAVVAIHQKVERLCKAIQSCKKNKSV